jgi:hypothetical protein
MMMNNRFHKLFTLGKACAKREKLSFSQELLEMVIRLFLEQEEEIYSVENRHYARINGRKDDPMSLVSWWTFRGGEGAFWEKRQEIREYVRRKYSQEELLVVGNILQGALAVEDHHRHYALKDWKKERVHTLPLKVWIFLHATQWMGKYIRLRFSETRGGVFP